MIVQFKIIYNTLYNCMFNTMNYETFVEEEHYTTVAHNKSIWLNTKNTHVRFYCDVNSLFWQYSTQKINWIQLWIKIKLIYKYMVSRSKLIDRSAKLHNSIRFVPIYFITFVRIICNNLQFIQLVLYTKISDQRLTS